MHKHDQNRISLAIEGLAASRELHTVSRQSAIRPAEFPSIAQSWGAILGLLFAVWMLTVSSMAGAQAPAPITRLQTFEENSILALNPEWITDSEVREVLFKAPAPRIFLFKGTLLANMESFGNFLREMGYPDEKLRNPKTGSYSYTLEWPMFGCTCVECPNMVGALAWYYEKEGFVPMLIGHSGGGVAVSRILYGLAAADGTLAGEADADNKPVPVWNPVTRQPEPRYMVRDPLTGAQRHLSDLRVPYVAMLATGFLMRMTPWFPGCWKDKAKLAYIPDSVEDFTGFQIDKDPFRGDMPEFESSLPATRSPHIRNVMLSSKVDHVKAFEMDGFAQNAQVRAWINAYRPEIYDPPPKVLGLDVSNIIQAADIWRSVKKHWCIEAQRLILTQRRVAQNPMQ
jgi:hypothetical protein